MNYGYTMITPTLAIAPVVCEAGWWPCGVDGNSLHVTNGQDERRVEMPFYDKGACHVETFKVSTADGPESVSMLIPHPQGRHVCDVEIDVTRGQMFAIARVGTGGDLR